jgi:lysophospholipase L1-like esterase
MPTFRALKRGGRALVVLVVVATTLLGIGELGLRALYAYAFWSTERSPLIYERVYWAVPPWVADTSVLYEDPELGLWMKPRASRSYINLFGPIGDLGEVGSLFNRLFPALPDWAMARPVWHLTTNSVGLRGGELPGDKAADTFRIVVLGDSWTVGVNVENEDGYPVRLAKILAASAAAHRVAVLNYGVVGGHAETGRRLLPRILPLHPDLVVVAYAQNDEAEVSDTRPRPARPPGPPPPRPFRWAAFARNFALYNLCVWWRTPGEDRIEATLRHELTRISAVPVNVPGRPCPNRGFDATPYRATIDDIVRTLADAGVPSLLLYNSVPDFASHCTLRALQSVAEQRGVPLVDSSAVLEALEQQTAGDDDARFALAVTEPRRSTRPHTADAVFRVDMSGEPDGRRAFVMGNHPQLGSFVPNAVPLHDDGSHGDQRAGDGVWSAKFTFTDPQVLTYAFTDGAPAGSWTGLENYRLRAFALRPEDLGHSVYLPIARFGRHALRSDSSHPDAIGHHAIAQALADVIEGSAQFTAFAGSQRP